MNQVRPHRSSRRPSAAMLALAAICVSPLLGMATAVILPARPAVSGEAKAGATGATGATGLHTAKERSGAEEVRKRAA